ncbi:MAG: hypothetical protein IKW04_04105 [Clostridia bacterium]|nr:hypothetical protein [Clostridia bacterium]
MMNGLFSNDCCQSNPCCDNTYRNCCDNNDNWITIIIIIAVILLFCFNN